MSRKIVCSCGNASESVPDFINHIRIHRNLLFFKCPVDKCELAFKSYRSFRNHLKKRHSAAVVGPSRKCTLAFCTFEDTDIKRIFKHAQKHISDGQPVYCPLRCPRRKPFATFNSLRLHNLYAHKFDFVQMRKDCIANVNASIREPDFSAETPIENASEDGEEPINPGRADGLIDSVYDLECAVEKLLSCLFLKLLSKYHITETAIQEVVEVLFQVGTLQHKIVKQKCEVLSGQLQLTPLSKLSLSNALDDGILQKMFGPEGSFRSAHMRKLYFSKNFSFVAPEKVDLQKDNNHIECFYHYVPILDTLQSLLNDKIVYDAIFGLKTSLPGYLCDYTDGLKFKNSPFFNDKTLNLFIYQDAAEVVVNAIGNATSRYKLYCIYMVIGNVDPHLRGLTDNVHLVALCKNKDLAYFGMDSVYRRMIEDLKILEEEGIVVNVEGKDERIFGSVFTTMNDNLGAHQVAGLTENFSRSSYFCRTCYVNHDSFAEDPLCKAEKRTPESNDYDLEVIREDPQKIPFRGVKRSSVFNELRYFNIFDCGSAPCIAHDIFEGWANSDMFLILKRMVTERTISLNFLQGRVNSLFKQLKINTKIEFNFTRKSKNIKAKACDIWHFIQIVPFIFIQKNVNYNDPMVKMLLLIKKITDTVTSTVVSESQIRILASDYEEYIEMRETQFSVPLRPKHHFCTHYPQLILSLGPLMSYCTLHCERKHCFFKRCLRSTLNFKNVTKFCTDQHQYYQGLLSTQTVRYQNDFMLDNFMENMEYLPMKTQDLLREHELDKISNIYVEKGSYLGYSYESGKYLFLEHDEYGENFYVMKINLIIYNKVSRKIVVLGRKTTVCNVHEKGLMKILDADDAEDRLICKGIEEFIDRAPLDSFQEKDETYLFVKHSIPLM